MKTVLSQAEASTLDRLTEACPEGYSVKIREEFQYLGEQGEEHVVDFLIVNSHQKPVAAFQMDKAIPLSDYETEAILRKDQGLVTLGIPVFNLEWSKQPDPDAIKLTISRCIENRNQMAILSRNRLEELQEALKKKAIKSKGDSLLKRWFQNMLVRIVGTSLTLFIMIGMCTGFIGMMNDEIWVQEFMDKGEAFAEFIKQPKEVIQDTIDRNVRNEAARNAEAIQRNLDIRLGKDPQMIKSLVEESKGRFTEITGPDAGAVVQQAVNEETKHVGMLINEVGKQRVIEAGINTQVVVRNGVQTLGPRLESAMPVTRSGEKLSGKSIIREDFMTDMVTLIQSQAPQVQRQTQPSKP